MQKTQSCMNFLRVANMVELFLTLQRKFVKLIATITLFTPWREKKSSAIFKTSSNSFIPLLHTVFSKLAYMCLYLCTMKWSFRWYQDHHHQMNNINSIVNTINTGIHIRALEKNVGLLFDFIFV